MNNKDTKKKYLKNFLILVGGIYCSFKFIKLTQLSKQYFFPKKYNLLDRYGNGWTIITGATDGLGKSYAKEFNKIGNNLLLISRNEDKLKKTISELRENNYLKNQIKENKINYIVIDFSEEYNPQRLEFLKNEIKSYEINILVNNVGTADLDYYENLSDDKILRTINTNILSSVFLTKIVLENMKKRKDKSLIVFVGSDLINYNPPFLQIYNSTKSFLYSFSESISKEDDKVDFTYLAPGPIKTPLNPRNSFFKVESDEFTKHSIKQFGNYTFSFGHYLHAIKNLIHSNILIKYLYTNKSLKEEFKPKI